MLPSTGLFRNIACPYYEEGECIRPFCHFLHAPRRVESAKPVYHASKIEQKIDDPQDFEKKKPQYIPITASYKPTKILKKQNNSYNPNPVNLENSTSLPSYVPSKIEAIQKIEECPVEVKPNDIEKAPDNDIIQKVEKKESSSSSSRHRDHHSNSSSSHKKSSKDRHRSSHHKSSSHRESRSSSSSSSHRHKSSKSSSSSRHKSSSSSSSRHKSSSKHKHRDQSKEKEGNSSKIQKISKDDVVEKKVEEPKPVQIDEVEEKVIPDIDIDYEDVDFEEDDIEVQCRMIFENYQPNSEIQNDPPQKQKKDLEQPDETHFEAGKKRLAHENASKAAKTIQTVRQNHSQSALLTAQKRHDVAIQKALAEKRAREEEIAKIEAEIKEKEKSMTPLVNPLIYVRPPPMKRPSIAPISQRMAIEAAKRKVMELNKTMDRQFKQSATVAQTSSSSSGRVAHVPTNINNLDVDMSKLAPPILEAHQTKISCNIRTQFYKMMVKHCLDIYSLPADAFERAQNEEFQVMKKCSVISIYKTSAMLAINRLKKEAESSGSKKNAKLISHDVILAGAAGSRVSWSVNNKHKVANSESSLLTIDNCTSSQAYDLISECTLSEDQLRENGYPREGVSRRAQLYVPKPAKPQNGREGDNYCARCHKVFNIEIYDELHADLCNYHAKRSGYKRGHADNYYYCCQAPAGTTGCCYADYHVTDYIDYDNLVGYVATMEKDESYQCTKRDIFALDCEMCYTIVGLELTRITVVNYDEKVVYDKYVRPQNRVIDYNTKYSGITEETLSTNDALTLPEIQAVLLSMFHTNTILIGHSLESDLKALKLIHSKVVDTSVLYPHKMGPPKKRALKTICIEYLKKIIQEDDAGHDSAEDSLVCIQLVKCYLRNRIVN